MKHTTHALDEGERLKDRNLQLVKTAAQACLKVRSKRGPKRPPKSNPKDEKHSKTSNLPNARSPKRGEKSTEKRSPKKGTKIPPRCPLKSSFNFMSFFNLIQFRKGPPCERSEPLFPNNHLLNFPTFIQFSSLLHFRRLPQMAPVRA
jgi:hypothetical protein